MLTETTSGESVLMSALQASVADTAGTSFIPRLAISKTIVLDTILVGRL